MKGTRRGVPLLSSIPILHVLYKSLFVNSPVNIEHCLSHDTVLKFYFNVKAHWYEHHYNYLHLVSYKTLPRVSCFKLTCPISPF